jgi:hypothetical protein
MQTLKLNWLFVSKLLILTTFVFALTIDGFSQQPAGRRVEPGKKSTFNLKELEKNPKSKADTTKRKKTENREITPGDLPIPPGARIIRHNPPPKSDTARFRLRAKRKDNKENLNPNFPGLGDNNTSIPPDIGGAAGPNHLMIALNTEVRIQDKAGVNISTVSLDAFFSSLGGAPNMFDPKVLYDPFEQRWIITACANSVSANSSLMIGVSATNDPSGTWTLFEFDVDAANTNWFDYPSIGFNKNWIVVTGNMFTIAAGAFANEAVYIFDKAALYGGTATTTVFNRPTSEGFTVCPAITLDNNEETEYLVSAFSSAAGTLRLYTITGTPSAPVYTATSLFPASAVTWAANPPGGNNFAPQSTVTDLIQNNDRRIQNAVFRNGSLWCAHTVFLPAGASPTRSGVQWWQIDPVTGTVQQNEKIQDPAGVNFFAFPTLGVNAYNDMLIGYSSFSASQFASCNYSVRLHTDAVNTTQASVQYRAGLAKYMKDFGSGANRWGDYSSTGIDPDDFSIWTIQEYAALPSGGWDRWGTEWNKWVPPVPELFAKDRDEDVGAEPNPSTAAMWQSPDIWVRKAQDPSHTFAHVHENAEYRDGTSNPNYVYVEVRNRGAVPSLGTEQITMYWAKAGSGLGWPDPWNGGVFFDPGPNTMPMGDVIGTVTIPVIAPGSSAFVEFAWNPPDPDTYAIAFGSQQNHFCLLARITTSTSSPFGMTFLEGASINDNVRNNNNIAWKNIGVYDLLSGTSAPVQAVVANMTATKLLAKFQVELLDENGQPGLMDKGRIRITPKGELAKRFSTMSIGGEAVRRNEDGTIDIMQQLGAIENVEIQPREHLLMDIAFIPDNAKDVGAGYAINFTQLANIDGEDKVVGGQTFVFGIVKGFLTQPGTKGLGSFSFSWWWLVVLIFLLALIVIFLRRRAATS